jgi:uncharacterized oxidoreductase
LPSITHENLLSFATNLLSAGGARPEEASTVASSLVQSNLRGHDSHGVMRIPFYVGRVKEGVIQPGSQLSIENETAAAIVADGGWGFGQVLSLELMNLLCNKAAEMGIACGTLRRVSHIGRLGEYAELAAEKGMAAIICANTHGAAQRVAPVGGKRPRLGTNPLCIGMPGGKDGPFMLDFGTSATAEGKVRVKKIAGELVPDGWLLDSEGNPTNDPNKLYGDPPGTIRPMGGDQAYKGFGLAFMIEMLCGVLSGGQVVHADPPPPTGNCVLFIVLNPNQLGGMDHLKQELSQLEGYVRGVPTIDGVDSVILPGDPERNTLAARSETGIPLDDGNWDALLKLAAELDVSLPEITA